MTSTLAESSMRTFEIPLSEIFCDEEFNCRGPIPPIDVVDLARSVEEKGLLQPITVQPYDKKPGYRYRTVSGHRRYSAFRVLNRQTIPAIIKEGLSELDARQLNLEENLKRRDLNLLQEANALKPFLKAGWTQEEMASKFNQSRGWVQARVALLDLPTEIQQEAAAGFLTQEHIKQLKGIKNREQQFDSVRRIKAAKMAGEKKKIVATPKKRKPLAKRRRSNPEIFELMEELMEVVGPGFWSRCLAWATGEISDFDLYQDFQSYAAEQGINWEIPRSVINAVVNS